MQHSALALGPLLDERPNGVLVRRHSHAQKRYRHELAHFHTNKRSARDASERSLEEKRARAECSERRRKVSNSTGSRAPVSKTTRSNYREDRPFNNKHDPSADPFVKHTGAARRSPLLLMLFNTTRKDPQAFLQTPKHGGRYRMDRGVWPTQPAIPRP